MEFNEYAPYYDLLNSGKDYLAEVKYINTLIQLKMPGAKRILELGCGTGIHAKLLSEFGYTIVGIDKSIDMVNLARQKNQNNSSLSFFCSDIEKFSTEEKFDIVISIFHVISYITENKSLKDVFKKINTLLNSGGYFIFDCWNGTGVLSDLPHVRYKNISDEQYNIHRISLPTIYFNKNLVNVNFKFIVLEKNVNYKEFEENHLMRYFFETEINLLCLSSGFDEDYLENNPLSTGWYALYACQKIIDIENQ